MRVRVIKRFVPGIGVLGAQKNIDNASARALILLGKVERVETTKVREEKPAPATPPKKAPARTYKRRDMQAEQPMAEAPSVAPVAAAGPARAPWDDPEPATDVADPVASDEPTEETEE